MYTFSISSSLAIIFEYLCGNGQGPIIEKTLHLILDGLIEGGALSCLYMAENIQNYCFYTDTTHLFESI